MIFKVVVFPHPLGPIKLKIHFFLYLNLSLLRLYYLHSSCPRIYRSNLLPMTATMAAVFCRIADILREASVSGQLSVLRLLLALLCGLAVLSAFASENPLRKDEDHKAGKTRPQKIQLTSPSCKDQCRSNRITDPTSPSGQLKGASMRLKTNLLAGRNRAVHYIVTLTRRHNLLAVRRRR